jgi:hypothetical protein
MARFRGRMIVALCVALAGGVANGCGSNLYEHAPVRGRVTCDGKPATGGKVLFLPRDDSAKTGRPAGHSGSASSGTVSADGTFTLTSVDGKSGDGALIGPHQVVFELPPTKRPPITADDRLALSPEELKALQEDIARRPIYPPLPCGATITPATVEVKRGENQFEFTLQPKK